MVLPKLMRVYDPQGVYTFELHLKNKVIAISDMLGGLHTYLLKQTIQCKDAANSNDIYTLLWHKWCEPTIDKTIIFEGYLTEDEAQAILAFDAYIWENPIICGFIFSIYAKKNCEDLGPIEVMYIPQVQVIVGRSGRKESEIRLLCKEATLVNDKIDESMLIQSTRTKRMKALRNKLQINPDYYFSITERELIDNFHIEYLPTLKQKRA